MKFSETLLMAAGSLWGHKTRSVLTILGVVIGIGSVLAVVTLGQSFEHGIVSQFNDVDNRAVFATSTLKGTGDHGPPNAGAFGDIFTSRDAQNLAGLPHVQEVVPTGSLPTTAFSMEGKTLVFSAVTATTSHSSSVRADKAQYASGGPFQDGQAQIVVGDSLGQILANLTGHAIVAGEHVQIHFPDGSIRDTVLAGVLAHSDTLFGAANTAAYVPLDPFYHVQVQSPRTNATVTLYRSIAVLSDSAANAGTVRDEVKAYVTGPTADSSALKSSQTDIEVATSSDITSAISTAFNQVTAFIGAIAVVSLIVGAIGIANIMLVSVTERIREIGIMKAIGARNGEILRLFLVESVLIGVIGSAIGIGLGLALGSLVVGVLLSASKVAIVIPYPWIGYALLVGIGVGAAAGILPARRATKIEPIRALAHE
ncbi:MAG: ABC transporter permease [Thermoplasmatota archaeon]